VYLHVKASSPRQGYGLLFYKKNKLVMTDFNAIRVVALDVANHSSEDAQDQVGELIWVLLQRNYQILVFSSKGNLEVAREDFRHPGLSFIQLTGEPGAHWVQTYPALGEPTTLWVSDHGPIQAWVSAQGLPLAYQEASEHALPWHFHYAALAEVGYLLDPSEFAYRAVGDWIADQQQQHPGATLVLAMGGPPMSLFQQFALELKHSLEAQGLPLVELLDISGFIKASGDTSLDDLEKSPWVSDAAAHWLMAEVVEPALRGEPVFVEHASDEIPPAFLAHLPLYVAPGSVLLLFAEMALVEDMAQEVSATVLLEMNESESARRLFEVGEVGTLDPMFLSRYHAHEGKAYAWYLAAHHVARHAMFRVDANTPGVFRLLREPEGLPV